MVTNYERLGHINFDRNVPGIKSSVSAWCEGGNIADSGSDRKDRNGR